MSEPKMIHLTINHMPVEVPAGTRIIEAAQSIGIDIPHLCYHPDQSIKAHCRMCMVEVAGQRKLLAACSTLVWDGMEVVTDSKRVYDAQVGVLDLILADHRQDCLACSRNNNCDLQNLCRRFNRLKPDLPDVSSQERPRLDNPSIVRDPSKCVKCGRCVKVCSEVQGIGALSFTGRSADCKVTTAFDLPMNETDCVLCGQCTLVCPVGALTEVDHTSHVRHALHDSKKHVVVQIAPSVRVALGDDFGLAPGALVTGKMVTALKMMGFEKVFDTNFAADLTIMEEGSELLERIQKGGRLPMITSCSPGWVNFMEKHHPELIGNLSTAKSPQGMFGAVLKTYYAQRMGWDPKDIFSVSVMPCTAKKFEATRPELAIRMWMWSSPPGSSPSSSAMRDSIRSTCPRATLTLPWAPAQARAPSSAPPAASWRPPCAPPMSSTPRRNCPGWNSRRSAARWAASRRPLSIWTAPPSRWRWSTA